MATKLRMMNDTDKPTVLDAILKNEPRIILFDGVCNLCSHSVQFILRFNRDESIRFASVQSELGAVILKHYDMPTGSYDTMLYIENGQLYTKSAAAIRIAKQLRFPWSLLQGLVVIPPMIRDWLYDRIARNRYRLFGKKEQCYLPDEKTLKRFLDN